jgi:hypothetical protein
MKPKKGGYNSMGRIIVCGTISSLFKSEYPPYYYNIIKKSLITLFI